MGNFETPRREVLKGLGCSLGYVGLASGRDDAGREPTNGHDDAGRGPSGVVVRSLRRRPLGEKGTAAERGSRGGNDTDADRGSRSDDAETDRGSRNDDAETDPLAGGVRWRSRRVAYELRGVPAEPVAAGFEAWSSLAGTPEFVRVERAENVVRFGDLGDSTGEVARTTVRYDPQAKRIEGFEIVLADGERWADIAECAPAARATRLDLRGALTQQAGAVIGLAPDRENPLRAMHATTAYGETVKRTPTDRDLLAAEARYARE